MPLDGSTPPNLRHTHWNYPPDVALLLSGCIRLHAGARIGTDFATGRGYHHVYADRGWDTGDVYADFYVDGDQNAWSGDGHLAVNARSICDRDQAAIAFAHRHFNGRANRTAVGRSPHTPARLCLGCDSQSFDSYSTIACLSSFAAAANLRLRSSTDAIDIAPPAGDGIINNLDFRQLSEDWLK